MRIFLATENPGKVREIRALFSERLPQAELLSIADLPASTRAKYSAEETGSTYAENSLIKARALAQLIDTGAKMPSAATQLSTGTAASALTPPWILADAKTASLPTSALTPPWILAEDSGFEVEALGGEPGVYSARYAVDDNARCEKVLAAIRDVPVSHRQAQFVACVTLLEAGSRAMQHQYREDSGADGLPQLYRRNPVYFFGRRGGIVAGEQRGTRGFGYDPIFIPDGETATWGEAPETSKLLRSHRGIAMGLAIDYLIVRLSQKKEHA